LDYNKRKLAQLETLLYYKNKAPLFPFLLNPNPPHPNPSLSSLRKPEVPLLLSSVLSI